MTKTKTKRGRPIKGKSKRIRVSFTLEPKNIDRLDSFAGNMGVSKSEALDLAISEFVKNQSSKHMIKNDLTKARISVPKLKLIEFCKEKGIKKLFLFGSVLTPEFNKNSDIDILVEYKSNQIPTLFNLSDYEWELSKLFHGRKIDLRTMADLSTHIRKKVVNKVLPVYEE